MPLRGFRLRQPRLGLGLCLGLGLGVGLRRKRLPLFFPEPGLSGLILLVNGLRGGRIDMRTIRAIAL